MCWRVGQSVSNQGVSIRLRVYGYACVCVCDGVMVVGSGIMKWDRVTSGEVG